MRAMITAVKNRDTRSSWPFFARIFIAMGPPLTSAIASTEPASNAPSALESSDHGASGPSVMSPRWPRSDSRTATSGAMPRANPYQPA